MRYFLAVITLLFAIACSSPNKIPDDVLSIDKMKPIVWDMMRAGTLAQNLSGIDTIKLRKESAGKYQEVFSVYGITKDEFYNSYQYYVEHPDKQKILLDSVVSYANRKRMDLFQTIHAQ